MAQELAPLGQPVGIFNDFIFPKQQEIVVDEKGLSLTGDSFRVSLIDGTPLLKVQGKFFSMRQRKAVYDMSDRHLFTIRSKASAFLRVVYWIEDPSDKFIMEVKFSASKFFGEKATITFTSASGKAQTLQLDADWRSKKGEIKDLGTGAVVARISRQSTAKHYLGGAQTYIVAIAAGMDAALVMAMCIALDESNERGKGAAA